MTSWRTFDSRSPRYGRGHITNRLAPICVTGRGEYLVITEWAATSSVDDAHMDEIVLDVWARALAVASGPAATRALRTLAANRQISGLR